MQENDSTLQQSLINKGLNVTLDSENNTLKIKCDALVVGSRSRRDKRNYFVREDYSSLEGPSMDQQYERGGMLTSNACFGRFNSWWQFNC
ncbi:hypothetical protein TSUD_83920 [Trifolium subterraneum]|uniref:Uncharacterized protein n=1 Tax=Trifolium subterraneum TaxID=3900 RepID=A0A2Z6N4R7_TRISU|nr:hypothetical protein TSUD_83920 [Trifolium subterraneum]